MRPVLPLIIALLVTHKGNVLNVPKAFTQAVVSALSAQSIARNVLKQTAALHVKINIL